MITRYRVQLNETHLDSIDDRICILDIQHAPPEFRRTIETPANMDGGIVTKSYREKATITVTFELHIYDTKTRNTVCQKIKTWAAAGGAVKTNERDGQVLQHCYCEQLPEIESAKNWTDPLTVVFSTVYFPYWENVAETALTLTGTNTSGTLKVPGNGGKDGRVEVYGTITANEALSWFEITAGSTTIKITANIAKDATVTIAKEKGYLTIKNGSTSLMGNRSATSSDWLLASCGKNTTVKLKASAKATATIKARGAWL